MFCQEISVTKAPDPRNIDDDKNNQKYFNTAFLAKHAGYEGSLIEKCS